MLTKWVVLSLAIAAFVHWTGPKVDAYAHENVKEEIEEVERELLDALKNAEKAEQVDERGQDDLDCEQVCDLADNGNDDFIDVCYQCVLDFCTDNPDFCDNDDDNTKRSEIGLSPWSETKLQKKAWIRIPTPRIPTPRIPIPRIPIPRIPLPRIPLPRIPIPRIPVPRIPTPRIPIPRIPSPSRWFKKK